MRYNNIYLSTITSLAEDYLKKATNDDSQGMRHLSQTNERSLPRHYHTLCIVFF